MKNECPDEQGSTPSSVSVDCRSLPERVATELRVKLSEAEMIQCLFMVDMQKGIPSVTCVPPDGATEDQIERFQQHLRGIAEVFREIYKDR
jgi:hypothetical protein